MTSLEGSYSSVGGGWVVRKPVGIPPSFFVPKSGLGKFLGPGTNADLGEPWYFLGGSFAKISRWTEMDVDVPSVLGPRCLEVRICIEIPVE